MNVTRATLTSVLILSVVPAAGAFAAEEPPPGWSDSAEFSYVTTSGNSETQTLGFKNTLQRRWTHALLTVLAGGIRAESEILTRDALDQNSDPNVTGFVKVVETRDDQLTAESYFVNGRYDHKITERFFWDAGTGWERNRFAGIEDRISVFGGVGNIWIRGDRARWATTYDVTYTDQTDVAENPDIDGTYMGFRLSSSYELKVAEASKYTNLLVADGNADESDDLRVDWTNSLAVSISKGMALKVSLQMLYDNRPAFVELDVFEESSPGVFNQKTGDTVLVELESLDTIFTASLVINF